MSNPASKKSSGTGPAYVPPEKRGKKKQIPWKQVGAKLSAASKTIASISIAHPVVAALGVMVVTTAAHIVCDATLGPPKPEDKFSTDQFKWRRWVIDDRIQGLYLGADGIAKASALAPVISALGGVAGTLLTAKAGAE